MREIGVPPTTTLEAPGVKTVPAMAILSLAAVMSRPPIVVVIELGDADSKDNVFDPAIRWLAVSKDSNVPSSVMPGAPGLRVMPAREIMFDAAVMAWPAMVVIICFGAGVMRGTVLVPIMRADEPKYIGVPDMVIGEAPLVKVEPAIAILSKAAVTTWPAIIVVIGVGTSSARGTVDLPMTRLDGSRRIGVPDTVIGDAPGVSV